MRVLITGGGGFLGAWLLKRLHTAGIETCVFDMHANRALAHGIAGPFVDTIDWHVGDIGSLASVTNAMHGCDAVAHLAGVLTPFCKDNPLEGARINVIGTLNVFEAARSHDISKVIYTSSGGVYGPDSNGHPVPVTHYGAFKLASEGSARAYWLDAGIASVGMRPFIIFGPGRESGLSAGPTLACRAAAHGKPYVIPFSGAADLVYVDDVALACERALIAPLKGAFTLDLTGQSIDMADLALKINGLCPGSEISCSGPVLPMAGGIHNEWDTTLLELGPETSLDTALEQTVQYYKPG
ncbi:MAG: NAD-dependent epimerase/dehydratase family protein [Beijerinckiaceae bacterium]